MDALQSDGLLIRGIEGGADLLPFTEVAAVVVGGIAAQPKAFLVLDLVLAPTVGAPRRVERLLSSTFDPRRLVGRPDLSGMDAFRELVRTIAAGAGARVVPETLLGPGKIPTFPTLEAYERDGLLPALDAGRG